MKSVQSIQSVHVSILKAGPLALASITATGTVPTTGWHNVRLSPWFYVTAPADGVWDFDLVGDAPFGPVGEVVLPVAAAVVLAYPAWFKGARVHSQTNAIEALAGEPLEAVAADTAPGESLRGGGVSISLSTAFNQTLGSYDDSFQPTGTIHWKNDGPFGTPNPHVEWKKLHHELVLTVSGPDDSRIRSCVNQAFTVGVLAAIAAAIASGGAGAAQAGISAALSALTSCLGAGFSARVNDNSHWVYWDA